MDFFSDSLSRLKHLLRVSKDGEVAVALGMKKTAFSERKKRGSFPEKELRALAQQRPELGIDVEWVLHGSLQERRVAAAAAVYAHSLEAVPQPAASEPFDGLAATDQESALVAHWKRCLPSDQQLLAALAARLAEKAEDER